MSNPVYYTVAGLASAYMCAFIVIYCFPYAVPFDEKNMNYSSLMVGGLTILVAGWWFWVQGRGYVGPGGVVLEGEARRSSVFVDEE